MRHRIRKHSRMSYKPGKPLAQQAVFLLQCAISSINVSATAIPGQSEPVHDAGVPRVAPQWRHGRQIPRLFLDLTRFNHPQTDNFIQLLFRMPVCRQNSVIVKVTVTLAIMLSPNLYVDQKTTGRLPVAATARQCFHPVSAASRFSVPHTDRRSVFAHQTFAFNAQSLPGWLLAE